MKIKVCGMTEAENLKTVLEYKPDFFGFIFYEKSPRNITDKQVLQVAINDTKKVGVFVNENIDEVNKLAIAYKLDSVQLHGDESPEYCDELKNSGTNVIKVFPIDEQFSFDLLKPYTAFVDYFLFDTKGTKRGGNGTRFDWGILDKYVLDIPFFLSGGITVDDVEEIRGLKHPQLHAVDINSGFEISPGIKNAELVAMFTKQIKE